MTERLITIKKEKPEIDLLYNLLIFFRISRLTCTFASSGGIRGSSLSGGKGWRSWSWVLSTLTSFGRRTRFLWTKKLPTFTRPPRKISFCGFSTLAKFLEAFGKFCVCVVDNLRIFYVFTFCVKSYDRWPKDGLRLTCISVSIKMILNYVDFWQKIKKHNLKQKLQWCKIVFNHLILVSVWWFFGNFFPNQHSFAQLFIKDTNAKNYFQNSKNVDVCCNAVNFI